MKPCVRWQWLLIALTACGSSAHGVTNEAQHQPPAAETSKPAPVTATAVAGEGQARVTLLPAGADPVQVRVEVASDEASRRRGLMFREHMDDDAGMLFLFERSEQLTFWMHNTYIPLDMIFIEPSSDDTAPALRGGATIDDTAPALRGGATMRVLGIVENAEPQTDSSRSVPGASQYVLEVNAGFARRHNLTKGTAVRFVGVPGFESEKVN
jgi:uncharacterized membrane protein (UPF0127 family)